jgi:serine/threonine-protein kinase RsbW
MATLRLSADLSQLCTIREFVSRTGDDLSLDEHIIQDLLLAVDEICSNVILHGYDGHGGDIEVTVQMSEAGVQAIVRDWGKTFDPESVCVPDIDAPLQQRPCGGLGLFLVRQLMDEVRFEFDGEKGNSVTMVKRVRREGDQERV